MNIRTTKSDDIPALQAVLAETELFRPEMLGDMLTPFLTEQDPEALWLTALQNDVAVGFCYLVAEMLTEGTWNMRAIAVHPTAQGSKVGAALTRASENHLRNLGCRVLIVNTSGTDEFARTRAFYEQNGYEQEARIRDFWSEGDDKVIFRKRL